MQLSAKVCTVVTSVCWAVASDSSQVVITGNADLHMCDNHHFVGKIPTDGGWWGKVFKLIFSILHRKVFVYVK